MNPEILLLSIFIGLTFPASFAFANDGINPKENYNLFNPTPPDQMREFITDRPDKTESAYSIDAGHFAHETDIINYSFDKEHGDQVDSALVMAPNLKVGLTNNIDLQLVVESFNYVSEKVDGQRSKQSGFGDLTTRLKVNLWGNDGGRTAFAVMPYVKAPTSRGNLGSGSVEGGIIAPLAINATDLFDICAMTEIDILRNDDHAGYHPEFVNSATFGRELGNEVAGYVELWSSLSEERGPIITADFGFTYGVVPDTQLDIGLNTGITDEADNLNPFIGISQRF